MKRRAGASLVELLAVIAAASVLIGLSAGLLQLLMDVGRSSEEHLARGLSLTRLGRQFRDDVRAANQAGRLPDDKAPVGGVTLILNDEQSVEYVVEKQAVVRLLRSSTAQTQREGFSLAAGVRARVEIDAQASAAANGRRFATLIVSRQSDGATGTSGEYRVEALLGGDHRFERQED